jgi:hypothetical protein
LKANIENVRLILQFLKLLEEYRDLSIVEWNFRLLLKQKYASLLNQQQIYCKQRGTIKWVICGDEGTKIFHAITTINQRKNSITFLEDAQGIHHSDQNAKAQFFGKLIKKDWALQKQSLCTLIWILFCMQLIIWSV